MGKVDGEMAKVKSMEQRTSQQRAPEKRARHGDKTGLVFDVFATMRLMDKKAKWREREGYEFTLAQQRDRCYLGGRFECDSGRNARGYEGAFHPGGILVSWTDD